MSVYQYAKSEYEDAVFYDDPYDKVYCVFDKDSHTKYNDAVNAINKAEPNGVWKAITSVPCFEYWILLHFVLTTQPYSRTGKKSPCEQVISQLKQYYNAYNKGKTTVFGDLIDKLDQAIINAKQSLQQANSTNTDNPTTQVHKLIEYMKTMKHR